MELAKKTMIEKINGLVEKYDLMQVVRYGLVGVCAAGTHAVMALVAYHLLNVTPTLSNVVGYFFGATISYLGTYYFTFRSTAGHKKSLPRFALIWVLLLVINVGLFKYLFTQFSVPFAINVFIAIVLTPIAQYLMLRLWAFRKTD